MKKLLNSLKNSFLILLSRVLQKRRTTYSPYEKARYLVISTTALGDTLWGTPAIRALKKTYPESRISVLTSPVGFAVLQNQPEIDQLFLLPKHLFFSFFSLLIKLRKERFDAVLIFHASQRLVFALSSSIGAQEIVGTTGQNKGLDSLLTTAIPWKNSHEIERRFDIVAKVGARRESPQLSYIPTKDEQQRAEEFLNQHPLKKPIIAFHPGAKDRYKCWSPQNFIELGKLLTKKNFSLIITGAAEEKDLIAKIADEIPEALAIIQPLPLRLFAAVLQKMDLVVTNDTGPMHLATALNVPTIALFAPTDPKICGPYFAENTHLIAKPRTCTPCLRRKCRDPFCLLQISPQEVFDKILTLNI